MNDYEQRLLRDTNKTLISNFNKVAEWIESNCPTLNGEFPCEHEVYHWTKLVVMEGKAYLETGSHGSCYELQLAVDGTRTQSNTYPEQFFRNDRLEEFLKQWQSIKRAIQCENEQQSIVYSDKFVP